LVVLCPGVTNGGSKGGLGEPWLPRFLAGPCLAPQFCDEFHVQARLIDMYNK